MFLASNFCNAGGFYTLDRGRFPVKMIKLTSNPGQVPKLEICTNADVIACCIATNSETTKIFNMSISEFASAVQRDGSLIKCSAKNQKNEYRLVSGELIFSIGSAMNED